MVYYAVKHESIATCGFAIVCLQVSFCLPWACLTWGVLLVLMPTDISALRVGNVTRHVQSWIDMFVMNVVQPGTSYSAEFVGGGSLDQTISDNMNICIH
jgi:hypothetical protein